MNETAKTKNSGSTNQHEEGESGDEERNEPGFLQSLQQLVRLENTPTAVADVLGAGLLVRHFKETGSLPQFLLLIGASVLLYSGGMVLNDVTDVRRDRELHPDRPLPAGRISVTVAFLLAAVLLFSGWLLSSFAGYFCGMLGGGLGLGIVIYNVLGSTHPIWGPVLMGLLRSGNFLLGLSLAGAAGVFWWTGVGFAFLLGLHIFLVTSISILEESPQRTGSFLLYFFGEIFLVCLLLLFVYVTVQDVSMTLNSIPPVLLFVVLFSFAFVRAWLNPTPASIGKTVGTGVKGEIYLNGGIVGGLIGMWQGLSFLILLVPIYVVRIFDRFVKAGSDGP